MDPAGPPRGTESELRDLVERYSLDRQGLLRRYPVDLSPERTARLKKYYADWEARVASIEFEPLGVEGRIDHIVLRRKIGAELRLIEREEKRRSETTDLPVEMVRARLTQQQLTRAITTRAGSR